MTRPFIPFPMQAQPNVFNTGLCYYFEDCSTCVDACMFPYCMIGAMKYKMNRIGLLPGVTGIDCFAMVCPMLCDYFGFAGMGMALFTCLNRRDLVAKYNIQEGCCESCCLSFFCPCCSLSQLHREMKIRGDYPGGVFLQPPPPIQQIVNVIQQGPTGILGGLLGGKV